MSLNGGMIGSPAESGDASSDQGWCGGNVRVCLCGIFACLFRFILSDSVGFNQTSGRGYMGSVSSVRLGDVNKINRRSSRDTSSFEC